MKTLLDMLDLTVSENYDNKIDAVNDLKDIIEELKSHTPEEVKHSLQSWSKNKLKDLQQDLIERWTELVLENDDMWRIYWNLLKQVINEYSNKD